MLYKEIADSADEKTQINMPNEQKTQIRQNTVSPEGRETRREEQGQGGQGQVQADPQGRLAMSLSGGGPTGLGLLSLAFPSNIMTSLRTADRFPSIMFTKSR